MSPVKFLFTFLFISIVLWLLFIFASKLVAWMLSRIMKASVAFKVSGWKCLKDVTIKFEKGAVESVSVGEIRFSLRQSLVKLGVGFMSRDPKLQLLISDIEIVTRTSNRSSKKTDSRKSRRSRSNPRRGKWMVVANMARFLSISVTDLVVKWSFDIFKVHSTNTNLMYGFDLKKMPRKKFFSQIRFYAYGISYLWKMS